MARHPGLVVALCLWALHSFGQEADGGRDGAARETSLYHALGGGLFTNTAFHLTSRWFGADFAQTSIDSVKTNLTSPWVWDSDHFLFNHPGHPYQGGLYHAAARSSGFTFYESVFFDALGSVTWELFAETDQPSLNDLIVTTTGGAALGEMLHLLYLETRSLWAGILTSPMDALVNAVRKKHPARTGNLYYFSSMTGAGWIQSIKEDRQYVDYLRENNIKTAPAPIYTGTIGCEVIYGNPFVQSSAKPYTQFEMKFYLGGSLYPLWLDWTLLTDGFLLSFNPVDGEKDMLSTGLTLHYDLIAGNNVNFASNALDWSLKWKRVFTAASLEVKAHTGWTFFGSSEYYPAAEVSGVSVEPGKADNEYGTGGNGKLFVTFRTQNHGKITAGVCTYILYIIPWNKPDSQGIEFFNLSFLEYAYPFTPHVSLVVNGSWYLKSGRSRSKAAVIAAASRIMLGVQWTLVEK